MQVELITASGKESFRLEVHSNLVTVLVSHLTLVTFFLINMLNLGITIVWIIQTATSMSGFQLVPMLSNLIGKLQLVFQKRYVIFAFCSVALCQVSTAVRIALTSSQFPVGESVQNVNKGCNYTVKVRLE